MPETYDYARAASTATRLLTRFGLPCVLTRKTRAPGDKPGVPGPEVETTYTITAAVLPISRRDTDGGVAEELDYTQQQFYAAPKDAQGQAVTIKRGDFIDHAGTTWKVDRVSPLKPAETVVLWQGEVVQ